jgi:hypothetical protein
MYLSQLQTDKFNGNYRTGSLGRVKKESHWCLLAIIEQEANMDMDYLFVRIIRKKIKETRERKLGSDNFIQFKSFEFTECKTST